ncbi:MAG: glycosyltransferase [Alphaproteobacteria bacterium]
MATRLLHVLPGFGTGGIQTQLAGIANALGDGFAHAILPLDGDASCRARIAAGVPVELVAPPRWVRAPMLHPLAARALLRGCAADLVVTYNWGGVEWCLANRLLGDAPGLHCEHGFGLEEATRRLWRRNALRRLALAGGVRLAVPSRALEQVAREEWHLSPGRIRVIANGIDAEAFARRAGPRTRPAGDGLVVGCVAPLRPEKDIGLLLRAFASASPDRPSWRLVVAGDGTQRVALEGLARDLGIAPRVAFAGSLADPAPLLARLDLFALPSRTEQMPFALLEAMAMALPVVATDVGDVARMLAPGNRLLLSRPGDEAGLAAALRRAGDDAALRARLGAANLEAARRHFPATAMVAAFGALYAELAGAGRS